MTTITFRAATADDIPALIALINLAYRGTEGTVGWTTEADLLDGVRIDTERLQADFELPCSTFLLAERDGQLLACSNVAASHGTGTFGTFAVDPAQQGGGIGTMMMEKAEAYAANEWGVATMQMTVIDVRYDLIAYYERRGYARTGIKKPFPYGNERVGIPKREDLQFEVLEKALATKPTRLHNESQDAP